jgi:DNA helicase-2/ATP-dependent DNA helicase PcrA
MLSETPEDEIDPLFEGLNSHQKRAVCHRKTPLLIVAGPGTGKTLTLTRRIAYLVRHGIAKPDQVLAVTFTNKAAEEMQERLAVLLGKDNRIAVQTFHSLGHEILREQHRREGKSGERQILDETEALNVVGEILSSMEGHWRRRDRIDILERISKAKQSLQTAEALETSDRQFGSIYRRYQKTLDDAGVIDLDDLIVRPVRLLENNPEVLGDYNTRFPFLSVDEYQDINHAQYRLVRLLSPGGENLCVIGDPDQAIYGFRGADSRYFLQFESDYPGAEIVHLEQSFRSSETILHASASLMSQNPHRGESCLWSGIAGDSFLSVAEYSTDKAEAESIVHMIEQLVGGTSYFSLDSGRVDSTEGSGDRTFSDFAVFYRLHFQGELLEEAFERSGIPFCRIGGEALARNARVRQVLQGLRDGLGNGGARHSRQGSVPSGRDGWDGDGLGDVVRHLIESRGYDPEEEALKALVRHAETWTRDKSEFLAQMALKSDLDMFDPRAEKVTLMTLHASKGLEFPLVFIAGCEADLLPYRPDGRLATSVDEERRLFYVGLTRAKEKVFLTRARKRTVFGRPVLQKPSPFLEEIEDYLRQADMNRRKRRQGRNGTQLPLF